MKSFTRRVGFLAPILILAVATAAVATERRGFVVARDTTAPERQLPADMDLTKIAGMPELPLVMPKVPITPTCVDENTSFVCNDGLGPENVPRNSWTNPAVYNYYEASCAPGTPVVVQVNRLTGDMDPAMTVCEGLHTDSADFPGPFSCLPGQFLTSADDNNGRPCFGGGSWADPRASFTCPASGEFTVAVYDFFGAGTNPTYEVHFRGVEPGFCGGGGIDCCDDILAAIRRVEDKLDARLDVAVSTRASSAQADAILTEILSLGARLEAINCGLVDLLVTPQGNRETDECGGRSWNDEHGNSGDGGGE